MALSDSKWLFIAIGSTPVVCALALLTNAYLVPVICVLPAYPVMVLFLKSGRRREAIVSMVVWAVLLGTSMTLLIYAMPEVAKIEILNGERYKAEMVEWVLTGVGREGTPSEFIPFHIMEAFIFVGLSLCTGSFVSIVMGAFLMNYMSYYVAQLALTGNNGWLLLLGWHPWSVLRIMSYVILGVVLSEPLLSKLMRYKYHFKEVKKIFYAALGLWVLDIIVKTLLASTWQQILRTGVGAGS